MNIKSIGLKGLTGVLAAGLLMTSGSIVSAEQKSRPTEVYFVPLHFIFDGQEMAPPSDQLGFIYEGSTYVPLRFLAYSLNKGVQWDGNTYTVTISEPSAQDKVIIQEYNINRIVRNGSSDYSRVSSLKSSLINTYWENVTYVFDGSTKTPPSDRPGIIYENTLYVPLRFISESIGKVIEWDPVTYSIKTNTPALSQKPNDEKPKAEVKPIEDKVIPSAGIPSGGGVATKPDYDSIIQDAESRLTNIRSSAESDFNNLLAQFNQTTDQAAKNALIIQGLSTLSSYQSQFNNIINDLEDKLNDNNYDSSVVASYRQQFDDLISQKMSEVGYN